MSEKLLVYHCAPTLAGLKSGSLFSCDCEDTYEARQVVALWNSTLNKKGVRAVIMKFIGKRVLIYVYRPGRLAMDLSQPAVQEFLITCGYTDMNLNNLLAVLASRINGSDEFPHEIGLFLGYPLVDVQGFIDNKGRNSHMTGYWKVYGDTEAATKMFQRYTKCTNVYTQKMQSGTTLDRLTVRSIRA